MSIHVEKKASGKAPKILVCLIVVLAALASSLFLLSDVNDVKKGGIVEISEGMTVKSVSRVMKDGGIIRFPLVFRVVSRIQGYDTQIKPGKIEVEKGMSYTDILDLLINAHGDTVKVLIPEGYEAHEIAEKFSVLVSEDEFNEALLKEYDYRFLQNLPDRENRLEGYLFPATYEFEVGTSAEEIIDTMLKTFDEHFKEEYYLRAEQLGMTVDEIVTLASIIERESNSGEDRAKVAGVFYNRINKNMRLQSCATVQYILKERKPVLSKKDTKIDSPYNTYTNDGLPVGPIASPGEECIIAALYPEETDALYFVLGSDGKHIFSATYEDHLKAKNGGK